jgi:hypothetical protein
MVTNATRFGTEKALEPLQRVNRAGQHFLGLINSIFTTPATASGRFADC